jgi:hypothetical protein
MKAATAALWVRIQDALKKLEKFENGRHMQHSDHHSQLAKQIRLKEPSYENIRFLGMY